MPLLLDSKSDASAFLRTMGLFQTVWISYANTLAVSETHGLMFCEQEFNLRALAAPDLCGYGYITVNDLLLPQEATSLSSWGQGLVPAANANSGAVHAVNAEWEFSCLFAPPDSERDQLHQQDDAARAQFMVFKIKDIDGHALPCGQVGFTVSYKQSAVPQLFRIESEAYPVPDAHSTRDWMASPSPDAAPVESPSLDEGETELSEFEVQVRELQRLKAEAEELRKVMKEQQRVVWRHFKAELKGLQGEIDQCEDIRCTINTAFQKAHWAIKTVCGGFRPAHQESRTSPRPEEVVGWQRFWNLPWGKTDSSVEPHPSPCKPPTDSVDRTQAGISMSDPSHDHRNECSASGTEAVLVGSGTKPRSPHSTHAARLSQHEDYLFDLALVVIQVLAIVALPLCLFIILLRQCVCRRRVKDRGAHESRRSADVIRRSHRRMAFRKWWANLWRDRRILDYEEKRALILEQERILELAMQDEIRQLQSAAEVVSSMVSGDDRNGSIASVRTPYQEHRRLSRRDSLPDYRSEASYGEPPPMYDDGDGALAELVVDGFQYQSTHGSSDRTISTDWTPDSSVVGTSVRGDISSDEEDAETDKHE